MPELYKKANAFVRPSPTRGILGGVAQATPDAILLCEVAGYDVVIVETVGVGQSEVAVRDTVDCLVLLVPPGGGDEIQGMKKDILEICDIVVVNKAGGNYLPIALETKAEYLRALHLHYTGY